MLHVTKQHLLKELEQLTRQIRCPQARKDQNPITREEQHLDPRREADREGETSHTREHDPYQLLGEDCNEERHGKNKKRRWAPTLLAGDRGEVVGAEVQGHPARNQPHEGSGKGPSSSLHGCPSTTN